MGRLNNYQQKSDRRALNEDQLRRPEADSDLTGTNFYRNKLTSRAYTSTNAGFSANRNQQTEQSLITADPSSEKMTYLKAEIDYMVDGFMRELIDFTAFNNLDEQIQSEIMNRYPQFFN